MGGAFKILSSSRTGSGAVGEIRTAFKLDREMQQMFELTVTAFDRGQPQLSRY